MSRGKTDYTLFFVSVHLSYIRRRSLYLISTKFIKYLNFIRHCVQYYGLWEIQAENTEKRFCIHNFPSGNKIELSLYICNIFWKSCNHVIGIETDIHYFSHNCLPPDHVSAAKKRGITKRYPSLDCLYLSVSDSVGLIKYNCILTDYSALYKYYFADI